MAMRPRIGITLRLDVESRRFYLGRDYSEAIEAFGGIPMHIPLIPKTEFIREVVAGLDGILLPGSDSDVDPKHYGQEPHPKLGQVVPEKDDVCRAVLSEADSRSLPIFAIFYGMQALNVHRGGSLIQDIASQVEGHIKHQQGSPRDRPSHSITCAEGSLIADISAGGRQRVNSHHHQAIGTVGKGLIATAHADDGVIECLEDSAPDRFCVGVQWHPELSWRSDPVSAALFERFVNACVS